MQILTGSGFGEKSSGPTRLFGKDEIIEVYRGLDSPIECKMLDCLTDSTPFGVTPAFYKSSVIDEVDEFISKIETLRRSPFCVFPQLPVDQYRLDFLLVFGPQVIDTSDPLFKSFRFALECDGKAHHQNRLRKDMARDEYMRSHYHLPTLRVSGEKILGRPAYVSERLGDLFEIITEAEAERISWLRERSEEFCLEPIDTLNLTYTAPKALLTRCSSALAALGYHWDRYPLEGLYPL